MGQRLTVQEFGTLFYELEHTAFRLEIQPFYNVPEEQEPVRLFLAGQPLQPPDDPGYVGWLDYLRERTAAGCRIERVRVQPDPPTDYQRWERWAGRWNVSAGETIRYMTPQDAERVGLPLRYDWWLFDSCRLFIMEFSPDRTLLGGELITDPAIVIQHCAWRDLAVHYSTPDAGVQATT